MKRLIKNETIILDGTEPKYAKEKEAFAKLGQIEDILEEFDINDLEELRLKLTAIDALQTGFRTEVEEPLVVETEDGFDVINNISVKLVESLQAQQRQAIKEFLMDYCGLKEK